MRDWDGDQWLSAISLVVSFIALVVSFVNFLIHL